MMCMSKTIFILGTLKLKFTAVILPCALVKTVKAPLLFEHTVWVSMVRDKMPSVIKVCDPCAYCKCLHPLHGVKTCIVVEMKECSPDEYLNAVSEVRDWSNVI